MTTRPRFLPERIADEPLRVSLRPESAAANPSATNPVASRSSPSRGCNSSTCRGRSRCSPPRTTSSPRPTTARAPARPYALRVAAAGGGVVRSSAGLGLATEPLPAGGCPRRHPRGRRRARRRRGDRGRAARLGRRPGAPGPACGLRLHRRLPARGGRPPRRAPGRDPLDPLRRARAAPSGGPGRARPDLHPGRRGLDLRRGDGGHRPGAGPGGGRSRPGRGPGGRPPPRRLPRSARAARPSSAPSCRSRCCRPCRAARRFEALQAWIADHLAEDLTVPRLAEAAGMSPRGFARHYRAATGLTPARALERQRVEAARRLLAETALPVKRIAARCGFGSEETLRRSFLRHVAVAPAAYRQRFRAGGAGPGWSGGGAGRAGCGGRRPCGTGDLTFPAASSTPPASRHRPESSTGFLRAGCRSGAAYVPPDGPSARMTDRATVPRPARGDAFAFPDTLLSAAARSHAWACALLVALCLVCFLPGDRLAPAHGPRRAALRPGLQADAGDRRPRRHPLPGARPGTRSRWASTGPGRGGRRRRGARRAERPHHHRPLPHPVPARAPSGRCSSPTGRPWPSCPGAGAFLAAALFGACVVLSAEARLAKTDALLCACAVATFGGLARAWLRRDAGTRHARASTPPRCWPSGSASPSAS